MPKRRRRRLHAAMTVAALSALATACQEREKQVVLFDLGHHPIGEPAVVLDRLEAALGEQGFEVRPLDHRIDASLLASASVLVFRAPLGAREADTWQASPRPTSSAFTEGEIQTIDSWVRAGAAWRPIPPPRAGSAPSGSST